MIADPVDANDEPIRPGDLLVVNNVYENRPDMYVYVGIGDFSDSTGFTVSDSYLLLSIEGRLNWTRLIEWFQLVQRYEC